MRFPSRAMVVAVGVAIAALVATAGALLAFRGQEGDGYRGSPPPEGVELASFDLRSYTGGRVSDESLRGKAVALTFLESKCKQACPVIAYEIARGIEELDENERDAVAAVAISTHPLDDTAANVETFLSSRRAVGLLDYLIGTETELRPVWQRFHVLSALDTGDADTHSASVHIYDLDGEWVSSLHPGIDLTAENLAHDLRVAIRASK
jgi:cytochrome oxidase Cu insertion factor (SCO1/SenC/PrrC family)